MKNDKNGNFFITFVPELRCKKKLTSTGSAYFKLAKSELGEGPLVTKTLKLNPVNGGGSDNAGKVFVQLDDSAKALLAETPRIYQKGKIDKELAKIPITSTELSVANASKKYKAIVNNSKFLSLILVFTGSLFGSALARAAMTVSLIIQMFHKFILFNTVFGDRLDWFLTATTNLMEDDDDDSSVKKLANRKKDGRLVNEADLNVSTIEAFFLDMFLMIGFILLRLIRGQMRKLFYSWEKKHGRNMYDIHWKLTSGFYKTAEAANFLIKPLLDKKDTSDEKVKVNQESLTNSKDEDEKEETQTQVIPTSNLTFGKRIILKLYGLTYLLEFVLITRFMVDIFIHTSFNIFAINYSYEFSILDTPASDKTTLYLISNILASIWMLSVLAWEVCRFLNRNLEFAKDDKQELKELIEEAQNKQK